MSRITRLILALAVAALLAPSARAGEALADPFQACDRAAAKAERDWNLPAGLLAAIGVVESGRLDPGGSRVAGWPWSINGAGWSFAAPSKAAAIDAVRLLQARGVRTIDVGCFQVDLFYHPGAFASLERAFDAEANAQAAARILSEARFATTGWDQAVALYHSASLLRGAWYLQKVYAAWPAARARLAVLRPEDAPTPAYVALLSPQARLVRVVTAADGAPPPREGLPRVITPADVPGIVRLP